MIRTGQLNKDRLISLQLTKKLSTTDKGNYRPISVLPSISKIFEKLLYEQLSDFMKDKLSPFLCGFRKQRSTQHALIRIIEKWKKCMDDSGTIVAVLMDLSKAYDCIPHDLLIAKLHAYGVRIKTLNPKQAGLFRMISATLLMIIHFKNAVKSVDEAKQKIECQCNLIIRWFVDNSMKINAETCHAIVLSKVSMVVWGCW